jgi:hypothetical protein
MTDGINEKVSIGLSAILATGARGEGAARR